jgi:hypothetical protein
MVGYIISDRFTIPFPLHIYAGNLSGPVVPLSVFDGFKIELTRPPHYRFQVKYLLPSEQWILPNTQPISPLPAGATLAERRLAAEIFKQTNDILRDYNSQENPPKVVGCNNFGEIMFTWSPSADKKVNHKLRWLEKGSSKVRLTTYTVSLDPAAEVPHIPVRIRP